MNQPKTNFLIAALFTICLTGISFAQNPPKKTSEPSFDVVLQTVAAFNNTTTKNDIPPTLSNVIKKIKSDFSFANYRLTSVFMQRVSNNGKFELKSLGYNENPDKNFPVFFEWSLYGLQNLIDESGKEIIQIQNFRFGQRIPIKGLNEVTTYEAVSLSNTISLPKNTPTIIGSMATSKPDELIFLILTVKPAEK